MNDHPRCTRPGKKSVRRHLRRLASLWREANNLAWSTVGRPGPVFTDTAPGPDKDRAWEEFNEDVAADQAEAGRLYRAALDSAPGWLREDAALLAKAHDRAFRGNDGIVAYGPGI